jgi:hypothetical protein
MKNPKTYAAMVNAPLVAKKLLQQLLTSPNLLDRHQLNLEFLKINRNIAQLNFFLELQLQVSLILEI